MRTIIKVVTLLLLASVNSGLQAQGEVVFHAPDSASSFRREWAVRSGQLLRRYAPEAGVTDSVASHRHRLAQGRLQVKDYIRVEHVTERLSPNATGAQQHAAQQRMDSLRRAVAQGTDFSTVAQPLPWMRLTELPQEWIDVLQTLPKDSVSQPFVSPLGIHLVKWTGRHDRVPEAATRPHLQHWAYSRQETDVPFSTDLEELCALYPAAEGELRALYRQMMDERTNPRHEEPSNNLSKKEQKALDKARKQQEKARKKAEKERAKAEKAQQKAAKKKRLLKITQE